MLTTAEALEAILAAMPEFDTETVALEATTGRVLRDDIIAERDQPPFDRVTMDGIAIRHAAFAAGNRSFTIQGRQHAGDPRLSLDSDLNCIEVMTGAVVPCIADCVVPVERISVDDGQASLEAGYVAKRRQFIHAQGSDHRRGRVLLTIGHRVQAPDVAIIASSGYDVVQVTRQPSVRVISTGNELVAAGQPLEDHQIRMSNGPSVVSLLQTHGYTDCQHDHLVDDKTILKKRLGEHLRQSDMMVLSGGVSMGKADFVPEVLAALGVTVVFHRISQRPGKPMWFGIGPDNQAVFALPGNPVSTLVCCRQYVVPALAQASRCHAMPGCVAVLAKNFSFSPNLTCFQPVEISSDADGHLLALPVKTNTSGDFAALSGTVGYIELALDQSEFAAGSVWPLYRWASM